MTATVIIPTIGVPELRTAITSVLSQSTDTQCLVVCDGVQFKGKTSAIVSEYLGNKNLKVCYLNDNVGANGYYGHRIYAAFSHLVNTEYVLFLDQDNWFENNHVKSCIDTIEDNNLDWAYSLRRIFDKDGTYICDDNCESLGNWDSCAGYKHIDTNCYCIRTNVAAHVASVWHGGWGQDRVYRDVLMTNYPKYIGTGVHTVAYRLAGNDGSVSKEFFDQGNKFMNDKYNGEFLWLNKV